MSRSTERDGVSTQADRLVLALVQMRCEADRRANLEKALARIEEASDEGADLICLQELFTSTYPCQDEDASRFDWAEPIPGPTSEALAKLAAARGVAVVASLFERRAAGVYHNTAIVLDHRGQQVGKYRKMHIPDDPLYYEKFYFTPGDLGIGAHTTATATGSVEIGPLVCWDQWFPEAARLSALAGAQVLVYPTAIGWQFDEAPTEDAAQHDAWETIQRAHAIANGCFVAAVNRVGHERLPAAGAGEGIRFWGQSFVADPMGRVIARASVDREETLVVECDLALVEKTRREWPFLRDRRIDAYAELGKRLRDS